MVRLSRILAAWALLAAATAMPGTAWAAGWKNWFITPDQQGGLLMKQGEYALAAERFEDAAWKGTAFYRAGDFEKAAAVFGRIRGPEAGYNRGNALLMLGRYEDAIDAYESALESRPDWAEARENLAIARVRLARLAPPEDDSGGTGGMLGADDIVFDEGGRVDRSGTEVTEEGGQAMSENEMRQVWLRRVQNDAADFLRARFSYQLYRRQQGEDP